MIGEIQIILAFVVEVKKYMHLLYACQRGDYD